LRTVRIGTVDIPEGPGELTLRAADIQGDNAFRLEKIILKG